MLYGSIVRMGRWVVSVRSIYRRVVETPVAVDSRQRHKYRMLHKNTTVYTQTRQVHTELDTALIHT